MNLDLEDAYAGLADEHKRIFELLGRLTQTRERTDLVPVLEQLHDLLVDHFSHEQFPGGLYDQLAMRGLERRDQLEVLIREHCEILSNMGGLLARARTAGLELQPELREDIARIVESLEQHELKEHRLAESVLHGK